MIHAVLRPERNSTAVFKPVNGSKATKGVGVGVGVRKTGQEVWKSLKEFRGKR